MHQKFTRREMLNLTGMAAAASLFGTRVAFAKEKVTPHLVEAEGAVVGDKEGGKIGLEILRSGGNAVDAAVSAIFGAMISQPSKCGVGGYGGSMMIALANGKVTSIDFNSTAPSAATPDMFPLDANGNVKGRVNAFGWLAAGVPGTMAGLQLALERYGTKSLRELLQPAIALSNAKPRTDKFFNYAALTKTLSTLAERNSVETFYRGDIAQEIAGAFQKNGGLVTAKDLAAYRARELEPYEIRWKDFTIFTAPLCSGGLTTLEALHFLKALKWDELPGNLQAAHAKLEALRLAWKDRWDLFGDPEFVQVPIKKLLSKDYAAEAAEKIRATVKAQKALPLQVEGAYQLGTMNISVVDKFGNVVACTCTHGGSYGAKIAVENLGVVLGHGMSRFAPQPGHPNSIAPGKRPIHNMSPMILTKNRKPVVAIGAAGGTKIPSAHYDFISRFVGRGDSFEAAVDAPRLNTVGTMDLRIEKEWPQSEKEFFKKLGYKITDYPGAVLSAVRFDPKTGATTGRNHFGNPFQEGEGQ